MQRLTFYGGRTNKALGKIGDAVIPRSLLIDTISLGPILDKLAAYEDTELQPNEVAWLKEMWALYGGEEGIGEVYAERDMLRSRVEYYEKEVDRLEATLYAKEKNKPASQTGNEG